MVDFSIIMPTVFPVTCHTDYVGKGSIFVAIEGYADNGVRYIKLAIDKGARTIVVQKNTQLSDDIVMYIREHSVIVRTVDNTRQALAEMSAEYASFPAHNLTIIGITGTKGKTTTSFILEHILCNAGYKTALISSARNRIAGTEFASPLTTPQPDYLHQFLKVCVENKVTYVVMEVAAQALSLHRVKGITFDGLIFTNFSHEHLEFYATLQDYFNAKRLLFSMGKSNAPILINGDDCHGRQLYTLCDNAQLYGFDLKALHYVGAHTVDPVYAIKMMIQNKTCTIDISCSALFGSYNGYNIIAAIAMALEFNISVPIIERSLSSFMGVPGRLQQHLLPNGARSFIDYAHNPESFRVVLSALRLLTDDLTVIFGAGGGRDKTKRPLMGDIAASIVDRVILTSDNPRLEDPEVIIQDICAGISQKHIDKVQIIIDRKKAIESAYKQSSQGSIIALLGKGPDEYQMVGVVKHYFSEKKILQELI